MTIAPIMCEICTRFYSDLYAKTVRTIPKGKNGYKPFEERFKAMKCQAFPDGIPEDIILSEFLHFEKHPLQKNDILFELNNSEYPDIQEGRLYLLEDFKEEYEKNKNKG